MKKEIEQFSAEWVFLENCICRFGEEEGMAVLGDLLSHSEMDWGEVLLQGARHNLLPLIAYSLNDNALSNKVPPEVLRLLWHSLLHNRRALQIGYDEAATITKLFEAESIPFVITKGYVFDSLLYRSTGIRQTNDLDMILSPKDKFRAAGLLQQAGYIPGYFDPGKNVLVEADERAKKFFHAVAEYAPEFVRRLPDPVVQAVYVDINFSLTWFNSPYRVSLDQALQQAIRMEIPGHYATIPVLSPEYQIIYTALHLFKEAWVESFGIKDGNDVNLTKFMDMYFLLSQQFDHVNLANFHALLDEHQLWKPLQWVIAHTERVFGSPFLEKWGFREPVSETWLSSWQSADYKVNYWKGTMRERLQKKVRSNLFLR